MSRETYFIVRDDQLIKVTENDGPRYLRKGAERIEEVVSYSFYAHNPDAKRAVEEYEKKYNTKFRGGFSK